MRFICYMRIYFDNYFIILSSGRLVMCVLTQRNKVIWMVIGGGVVAEPANFSLGFSCPFIFIHSLSVQLLSAIRTRSDITTHRRK